MEQRVAITGIGAISPLGNTALATWAAMCAGTCGIGPITHFDTDAFTVKVAAEVKGFDGNEYFGKRDAKHLDPCVQFALAASDEAMHDAGFDVEGAIDRERLASTWVRAWAACRHSSTTFTRLPTVGPAAHRPI